MSTNYIIALGKNLGENIVMKELVHAVYKAELWMHAGSLGSTQEVRVALGCRREQVSRFFHAIQTFRVHP